MGRRGMPGSSAGVFEEEWERGDRGGRRKEGGVGEVKLKTRTPILGCGELQHFAKKDYLT